VGNPDRWITRPGIVRALFYLLIPCLRGLPAG